MMCIKINVTLSFTWSSVLRCLHVRPTLYPDYPQNENSIKTPQCLQFAAGKITSSNKTIHVPPTLYPDYPQNENQK